jgi:hypothetical protein
MAERVEESVLRELTALLEKAARSIESGTAVGAATRFSIEAASAMLARGTSALADPDAVERAAVYLVAVEHLAPVLRAPEAAVFRALMDLCGEPADGVLTSALAEADPRVVAALRRSLVRITVTYDVTTVGSATRYLEIWSEADGSGINRKHIEQPISWDDVPDNVRGRRLEHGDHTATFQLFP